MAKAAQLNVALTPDLEAFVQDRVASGRFQTAGDVVREGLRLLEVREHEREAVIAELRGEIAVGLEQAKSGQLRDGETVFDELRRDPRLSQ
jgi:antitoxin ParD1/3/4